MEVWMDIDAEFVISAVEYEKKVVLEDFYGVRPDIEEGIYCLKVAIEVYRYSAERYEIEAIYGYVDETTEGGVGKRVYHMSKDYIDALSDSTIESIRITVDDTYNDAYNGV